MKSHRFLLIEIGIAAAVIFLLLWVMVPKFLASQNMNTPDVFPDDYMRASVERLMGVGTFEPFTRKELEEKGGRLEIRNSHNVEGLQHLKSIKEIVIRSESPTETPVAIELPALPKLKELVVIGEMFETLDVSKTPNIVELKIFNNSFKNLDFSHLDQLEEFSFHNYPSESIEFSNHPKLVSVGIRGSQQPNQQPILQHIDLSGNPLLHTIDFSFNQVTSIDFNSNSVLSFIDGMMNQLKEIKLPEENRLQQLHLDFNQLEEIDISMCENLEILTLAYNNIESIDLSQNINLQSLELSGNPVRTIDVSNSPNLQYLGLSADQIRKGDIRYANPRMRIQVVRPMVREGNRRIIDMSRDEYLMLQSEMHPYIQAIFEKNFPELNMYDYVPRQ